MSEARLIVGFFAALFLSACTTSEKSNPPASARKVIGPKGYTVDWDLPETDYFWLPKEVENDIKPASDDCKADVSAFVYHHLPRPPQYSYLGFRFEAGATEAARSCVVERLRAVPALTIYPKKK